MVAVREIMWSIIEIASTISAIAGLYALAGLEWTLLLAGCAGIILATARAARLHPAPPAVVDGDRW